VDQDVHSVGRTAAWAAMAAMNAAVAKELKEEQKEKDAEEVNSVRLFLRATVNCLRRCAGSLTKTSPPEPCQEVQDLLRSLHIKPKQLLSLYDTFHNLWHDENARIASKISEVSTRCFYTLITERRQWVENLLTRLLRLGDCWDTVTWDKFLWIFLRFCSLSRVELGQALFVMIAKEVESPTLHYLTSQELQVFFNNYRNCPVKSFNTESMDFAKLPLSRYYPSDFCEVVMRFPRLLNPLLHLQLSLQAYLPSSAFWDEFDQSSFCRKITFEFFTINKHRVYIRGEPPFRETCDMLAPDALGPDPVNKDQWILRTSAKRDNMGLQQVSVWGEQLPPEVLDLLPHTSQGPVAMQAAVDAINAKVFAVTIGVPMTVVRPNPSTASAKAAAPAQAVAAQSPPASPSRSGPPPQQLGVPALPGPPAPGNPVVAWTNRPDLPPPPASADWSKVRAAGNASAPDPGRLAITAATLDEEDAWPVDVLPPAWMKNCTIAPAPVRRGADPPLPTAAERKRLQWLDELRKREEAPEDIGGPLQ